MALKVINTPLLQILDFLLSNWTSAGWKWGLFKNNLTPVGTEYIGNITPADFSGYSGLQAFSSWNPSQFVDPRAVAVAAPVVWTHNGGAVSNSIYGYYVVDGFGALQWAERNPSAPVTIGSAGISYIVVPQFTLRSEF